MRTKGIFFAGMMIILTALSVRSTYAGGQGFGKPVRKEILVFSTMFQDSTSRQRPGSRPASPERSPQDIRDEQLRNQERRSIKQVPRSVPKLKPQPVGGQMPVQRPPVKMPKKGYGSQGY